MGEETILIVDDEQEIADLLTLYLKNENYRVQTFYKSEEALNYIRQQPVSLAILDIMMPDMDGFTLCSKIRQNYLFPIIMLTAKIEDIDKIQGLTLGADDYITKPFNPFGGSRKSKNTVTALQAVQYQSKYFHRADGIWQ